MKAYMYIILLDVTRYTLHATLLAVGLLAVGLLFKANS